MIKTFTKIILFTTVITFLSSCSSSFLSHRMYGHSYYVKADKKKIINYELNHGEHSEILNTPTLSASLENEPYVSTINIITQPKSEIIEGNSYETSKYKPVSEPACDEIILKEGKIVKAKVLEITDTEVKYKLCENLEGPIYNVKKSEVLLIKYSNGKEESFNNSKTQTKNKSKFEDDLLLFGLIGIVALAALTILLLSPDIFNNM